MATMLQTRGAIGRAQKLIPSILLLLVTACGTTPAPAGVSPSPASGPVPSQTAQVLPSAQPTATVIPTPAPRQVVDASTMYHKLLMGYQGWFSCPGDGTNAGWFHWFKDGPSDAAHFRVDMYPDISELTPAERCETSMHLPDGSPAPLYSAANPLTVMRHFQWMKDYDLDGVFLQRFVWELTIPKYRYQRQLVTDNVRAAAEATGRVFAIEYDVDTQNLSTAGVAQIEQDWKHLVDVDKITESPSYLHHNGKPVVGVYGFGLYLYRVTPAEGMEIVNFFENNPEPRFQATLMGGVPDSWLTLNRDSLSDPGWAEYYCSLDIISPWTVGRYATEAEADDWKARLITDMQAAQKCGAEYMPVVFPGTAFHNNNNETAFNLIPRRGGRFYWRQVYNALSLGAPMIFNAMFDEVDEDTAMFKIAETSADQPAGVELAAMDVDGEQLPSDWYLRLASAATRMLQGQIPLTDVLPLNPDGSLLSTFPTPMPTPQLYKVRIQLSTTSDWTTLALASGGRLTGPIAIVSSSPEATSATADAALFALNQSEDRSKAGEAVAMTVDVMLTDVEPASTLTFVIKRGDRGQTTVAFMTVTGAQPVTVLSETWDRKSGTRGENPHQFSVPADTLISGR